MKVAIEYISEEGLRVNEKIPANIWDMDSYNIKFIGDIDISCVFHNLEQEILVDSSISFTQVITCMRCLEQVTQNITRTFQNTYNIKELKDFIEIDNDLREEILLHLPMKVLCSQDCKGLCPKCGNNLNTVGCQCDKQ